MIPNFPINLRKYILYNATYVSTYIGIDSFYAKFLLASCQNKAYLRFSIPTSICAPNSNAPLALRSCISVLPLLQFPMGTADVTYPKSCAPILQDLLSLHLLKHHWNWWPRAETYLLDILHLPISRYVAQGGRSMSHQHLPVISPQQPQTQALLCSSTPSLLRYLHYLHVLLQTHLGS